MKHSTRYLEPWLGTLKMEVMTQRFIRPLLILSDERCPDCREFMIFVALDSVVSHRDRAIDYIGHYSCPVHGLQIVGEGEPTPAVLSPVPEQEVRKGAR